MSTCKQLVLILALIIGINFTSKATVIETVGASDCSTGWWSAFSTIKTLTGNGTIHLSFINHNKGSEANNWNNWSIVITNGKAVGEDGYAESLVLRADCYGWTDPVYSNGFWANNYNWDNFCTNLNGATVDMDITRNGDFIQVYTTVTTTSNVTYYSNFKSESSALPETIGAFLTLDSAYLEVTEASTNTNSDEFVGAPDYTTGWWSAFSKYSTLNGDGKIHYEFYNYTTGTGSNWNNFLIGITNDAAREDSTYSEYLILRSDNYGWASLYEAGKWGSTPDWTTFVSDLCGAYVSLDIVRSGSDISITGTITTTASKVLNYSFSTTGVTSDAIRSFLTAEAASLKITKTEVTQSTSGVANISIENTNAPVEYYNLQGVKVNSDNLSNGLYIRRQGNKATKVLIR